jgi:two-component system, sensor histidine kinase and response regulator
VKKILVIDDSADVRDFVVTTLQLAGYETLEAANGIEGVALAESRHPDLIICDINLPGMDGYGMLAAIRHAPQVAAIPFILMTGSAEQNNFRLGMTRGADDFLAKPFSADDLVETVVSRLVRQAQLEWETSQRVEKLRHEAVHKMSAELSTPINGLLDAITGIMVDYASHNPEGAYDTARLINQSATRLNELTESWAA